MVVVVVVVEVVVVYSLVVFRVFFSSFFFLLPDIIIPTVFQRRPRPGVITGNYIRIAICDRLKVRLFTLKVNIGILDVPKYKREFRKSHLKPI